MDGEAYLIKTSHVQNNIGTWEENTTEIKIFVSEKSMSRSEWYSAGQSGFKPEILLVTPYINYSGEETIRYNNKLYSIYRTYIRENSDNIELYLSEKVGNNVEKSGS